MARTALISKPLQDGGSFSSLGQRLFPDSKNPSGRMLDLLGKVR